MLLASAVVVWEWLNEHGRWRPYSPAVSHHIEAVVRAGPRAGGSVVLGQVDSRLAPYIIDLQSMNQFRQDTGTLRPVRRNYYDPSSAPGKGVVWEWENDNGSWTPYDMEVGITIQHAYEKQHPWIDLTSIGFSYVIDFSTMGQINRQTQRQRRVRRRLDLIYPMVTSSLPKAQSWPANPGSAASPPGPPCSCPQCVLVMSVKAAVVNGSAGPLQPPAARKNVAPSGVVKLPPPPGPGTKPLDSTGTIRGPIKSAPSQPIRRQASGTPAGATAGSPASPPGASVKTGRVALATLNRTNLQRLAIAQSRVLIASGVPTVPVKNLHGSSPVNPALAGITGILMSAAGLPVCLTRPPKLVLHPPPVSKSEIKSIPGVSNTSRKTTKKQAKKGKTPEEVLKKYLQKVRHPPDEDCTICMERLTASSGYKNPQPTVKPDLVGKLSRCGHSFHIYCLVAMYNNGNKDGSLQCPTCKTIYGVKTGTQPPGKMEYHLIPHSLPGHPDCKTIRIIYSIPPGVQGPEHPNPGKSFSARGFPRHCYLPDSEKGRKVLKLLLVAWDRRLIFAIGTSSTTGESDTVIWNEVHHKTEFGSNLTGHGYPDANYLDNVLAELAAQGISEDSTAQEKD
ncbi:E3 ubiquitin-protein ligase DTX4 isoform X3 [Rousettus aegyptiacus]|uniref:E3 ubiquitin-protein ligase n=1 Tax=Rousettus aegyptiacus TaxID=9407 RepID=A0A7J8GZ93_ROUAE|nr:E3 ubiquitin-protein ligase DTX4 isoform X3 [Rousettus aegyptiacus]KAF6464909.1 deltex E3 ubiquitin ligase 4 [Rousettus aegyptiacus]